MPNDAFYPVKLVVEEVRIAFVRDRADRGQLHLERASGRVTEAEAVAATGDQSAAARALHEADESARSGAGELLRVFQDEGNDQAAVQLVAFADEQRLRLGDLGAILVGDAADAAQAMVTGLERIEARLLSMTGACEGCPGGIPGGGVGFDFTDIPGADEDFQACPCDLATSGTPTAPLEPADPGTRPPVVVPPVTQPPRVPPVVEPQPSDPPVATPIPTEPPSTVEPTPPPPIEQPDLPQLPQLPDLTEPLADESQTLIDRVLRGVLNLLGGE